MTAVGETRVLPEDLGATVARLRPIFERLYASAHRCVGCVGRAAFVLRVAGAAAVVVAQDAPKRRNAIVFVADGLRHGSVNRGRYAGALQSPHRRRVLRQQPRRVSNADDAECGGDCDGTLPGRHGAVRQPDLHRVSAVHDRRRSGSSGTMVPDVEDPFVLADINRRFGGNYLREASLLAFARSYGYNTAALGKTGPAASQDLSEAAAVRGRMRDPVTIILEGATGTPRAVPLTAATLALLKAAGLAAGAAAAQSVRPGRTRCQARAPRSRASTVVRRCGHQGDTAGVCEERRAVRARVLVGRSGPHAARPGRQPESARARHQRRDVEGGDPERRSKSEADSRLPRRESRGARQHRISSSPPIMDSRRSAAATSMHRGAQRAAIRRASATRTPKAVKTSMTDSSRRDFSPSISRASSTCRCTTRNSRPSTIAASDAT